MAKRALSLMLEATRLDFLDFFDSTKAAFAAWWPHCKGGPADTGSNFHKVVVFFAQETE